MFSKEKLTYRGVPTTGLECADIPNSCGVNVLAAFVELLQALIEQNKNKHSNYIRSHFGSS